jgi:Flp pilus assembly protein TadG
MTHRVTIVGRQRHGERGQSLVEFAIVLPLLMVLGLGVVEVAYALLDNHVVTRLTREGSNLISRDTSLQDAATAMRSMSTRPIDFDKDARLIFSVLKKGATSGTANYDKVVLYQRYEFGTLTGVVSVLRTRGAGAFYGAPEYQAINSDTDANLQITNLPANLTMVRGGLLYVTEIYTRHELLTPLDRFGITVPDILYSVAYF